MKQLYILTAALLAAVFLFGCAAVVETSTETVTATIVEINVEPAVKHKIPFVKPDTYLVEKTEFEVILEYDGVRLTVTDTSFYMKHKNDLGAGVSCKLITEIYDDGTSHRSLMINE